MASTNRVQCSWASLFVEILARWQHGHKRLLYESGVTVFFEKIGEPVHDDSMTKK